MEARATLIEVDYMNEQIVLHVDACDIQGIMPGKEYNLKLTRAQKPKSLSANSYFHVLAGEIARAMVISRNRAKNILVARYGQDEMYEGEPMVYKTNAPEEYMMEREEPHTFPVRTVIENGKELTFYRVYRGVRTYNSYEMSQLIEGTVAEAKALGIEVLPPMELKRMAEEWQSIDT